MNMTIHLSLANQDTIPYELYNWIKYNMYSNSFHPLNINHSHRIHHSLRDFHGRSHQKNFVHFRRWIHIDNVFQTKDHLNNYNRFVHLDDLCLVGEDMPHNYRSYLWVQTIDRDLQIWYYSNAVDQTYMKFRNIFLFELIVLERIQYWTRWWVKPLKLFS